MTISGYVKVAVVVGAVSVLPLAACSSDEQKAAPGNTVTRDANGDLAAGGGARRLDGDQSQVIRDAINSSGAKNVIMLLGDGMGDSEITIARNYEKGAGGSFAGLDALPLTGQYTTYALNKDGKPELRHRLRGQRHGVDHRHQDVQRCARHRHQGHPAEDHPRAGQGTGLRDGRRHHLRDPGRHTCRALLPHQRAGLLRPRGNRQGLRCGDAREGRQGLGHRAAADHPTGRHDGRRRRVVRPERHGRRLRGQDTRGAGQGARLPDRPHRRPN